MDQEHISYRPLPSKIFGSISVITVCYSCYFISLAACKKNLSVLPIPTLCTVQNMAETEFIGVSPSQEAILQKTPTGRFIIQFSPSRILSLLRWKISLPEVSPLW